MIKTSEIKWESVDIKSHKGARYPGQVVIVTQVNEYGKEMPRYLLVAPDLIKDLEQEIGPTFKSYQGRYRLLKAGTMMALKPSMVGDVHIQEKWHRCSSLPVCREIHKVTHAWRHDGWVQDGMIIFKPVKETR